MRSEPPPSMPPMPLGILDRGRQSDLARRLAGAQAHILTDHEMLRALWDLHQPYAPWSAWCKCGQRDPCESRRILRGERL